MGACVCKEKSKRGVVNVAEHPPTVSVSHPGSAVSGQTNVTVCVAEGPNAAEGNRKLTV